VCRITPGDPRIEERAVIKKLSAGLTQTEAADQLGWSRKKVAGIVKRLQCRGVIEKLPAGGKALWQVIREDTLHQKIR
jgi:transposase